MSERLQTGDVVTSPNWDSGTAIIERIDWEAYKEPIAYFVGGGFWRVSRLHKVTERTGAEGEATK